MSLTTIYLPDPFRESMQLHNLQFLYQLCLLQKASFLTTLLFPSWTSFLIHFCDPCLLLSAPSFHKHSANIPLQTTAEMWPGDKNKQRYRRCGLISGDFQIHGHVFPSRTANTHSSLTLYEAPCQVLSRKLQEQNKNKRRTNPQPQGLYNREGVLKNLLEDELWILTDLVWILNFAYRCVTFCP